jgi:hypothetical protein
MTMAHRNIEKKAATAPVVTSKEEQLAEKQNAKLAGLAMGKLFSHKKSINNRHNRVR